MESQAEDFEAHGEPSQVRDRSDDAVLEKAGKEAVDGAAAIINEPLQRIAKTSSESEDTMHGPAVIPLFPPYEATSEAQGANEQDLDDQNFPGFRESEWTEDNAGDGETETGEDGQREDNAADDASRRNPLEMVGWKLPVGGADRIDNFEGRSAPQSLASAPSQKSLAAELDHYLDAWEGSSSATTR